MADKMNIYEKLLRARSKLSSMETFDESTILQVCSDIGLFCYTSVKDDDTELIVVDVETEEQVTFTSPTVIWPVHPDKIVIDHPTNMIDRNRYMKKYMYVNLFEIPNKEEIPW